MVGVGTAVAVGTGLGVGVGVGVGAGVGVAVEPGGSVGKGDAGSESPACVSLTTTDLLLTSIFTYAVFPSVVSTGPIHSSTTQPG